MILQVAILINSALYLTGVFVAGLLFNQYAWKGALLAAGLTYLGYFVQVTWPNARALAIALVVWSLAVGAAAGLVLL